jgi:hypothetical protein
VGLFGNQDAELDRLRQELADAATERAAVEARLAELQVQHDALAQALSDERAALAASRAAMQQARRVATQATVQATQLMAEKAQATAVRLERDRLRAELDLLRSQPAPEPVPAPPRPAPTPAVKAPAPTPPTPPAPKLPTPTPPAVPAPDSLLGWAFQDAVDSPATAAPLEIEQRRAYEPPPKPKPKALPPLPPAPVDPKPAAVPYERQPVFVGDPQPDFKLPEGVIYLFENPAGGPDHYLAFLVELLEIHMGSYMRVGAFSGPVGRLIVVVGPEGTREAFQKAEERGHNRWLVQLGLPPIRVEPTKTLTDADAGWRTWRNRVVRGELRRLDVDDAG